MPEKAIKTIANKYDKKPKTVERYWKQAKKSAGLPEAKDDAEDPIRNKYAYAMAITQRRLQGTGGKPHKKVSREQAEKMATESVLEAFPEITSYVKSGDYRNIKGVYEETNGISEGRWFGAVAASDEPFDYFRVVLRGPEAEKAAAKAALADALSPNEALSHSMIQDVLEYVLSEAGMACPKCASKNILAGTKNLKHHCSSCGNEWGDGGTPEKDADHKPHESFTGTGGMGDIAFGASPVKKKRKKKVKESYNDNYERPNQAERRTANRQADGSSPPIDDEIINEKPRPAKKRRRRR